MRFRALVIPTIFTVFAAIGCSASAPTSAPTDEPTEEGEDEVRAATVVVELALDAHGKCKMRTPSPRVKYNRVVRLKNVGSEPIAALVDLWDNFGGMPAPEGGDVAPGKFVSVKMNTKWWILEDDPESREWSTTIVCRRGPWSDDSVDFDEVGEVSVFR